MACVDDVHETEYKCEFQLKYGVNPHQDQSHIWSMKDSSLPFKILNGKPGYINLMDALNAWQLVKELRESLNVPAAASFKHVSPAGAAIAVPLSDKLRETYELGDKELSESALAYIRARNADPKSSFGDFAALSDTVDLSTAMFIKTCVSDGIIAPGYDDDALAILSAKKGGKYIVLEADADYKAPDVEFREIFGVVFSQKRNQLLINEENSLQRIVTKNSEIPSGARRDLILAAIALKYTQSNSVGFALDGQMIGVGSGQQSRVDCVRLAGGKALVWYLRQHPRVLGLKFKKGTKKVARLNARIQFIEGEFTPPEHKAWALNFDEVPEPLTSEEKAEFLKKFRGVSLSSDAFFPFRDNIDQASRFGVSYILQAGGSVQDPSVIGACDEYDIAMALNGIRLFHH
uniref:Bifunctional purine synthesis protein n=2 Tax=Hirondellea gigas TaxID=1518452 RepID=A0A6A7G7K5_9CRUS